MENPFGTGAIESKKDKRTISHSDLVSISEPLTIGGKDCIPSDILMQSKVGICTAISLIQDRQRANSKKYSPEFQYLLQKKFYDNNWIEGSSILSALKVAKNYGLLPAELWTYTTDADRELPYNQYIAKLQAVPDTDINQLITQCVDKIAGYAQIDVSDPQAIAKAIIDSEAGILCRYGCQKNWWTSITGIPSWQPVDIDPLRYAPETSGHAIGMYAFNYSSGATMQKLCNTWSSAWDIQGTANINWSTYPPTEAWVILKSNPMFKFTQTMKFGSRGNEVKELQKRLNMPTILNTGFFGTITKKYVMNYQKAHNLIPDGVVGKNTRDSLNL